VVETEAVFSERVADPVTSGALPDAVNALVLRHVTNQEALVKAIFTEDAGLAFRGLLGYPLVRIPQETTPGGCSVRCSARRASSSAARDACARGVDMNLSEGHLTGDSVWVSGWHAWQAQRRFRGPQWTR
jgi:hypothetical protein